MPTKRRISRTEEWTRNILLILLAIGIIAIFFNLDIVRKGESIFSNTANKKLQFSGDLKRGDYTEQERDKLLAYIKTRNKLFTEVKVEASPQDKYREVGPQSDILFEIHVTMADGTTFTSPVRRAPRQQLVMAVLQKLDKDVQAYLELKKQGKTPEKFINTM